MYNIIGTYKARNNSKNLFMNHYTQWYDSKNFKCKTNAVTMP